SDSSKVCRSRPLCFTTTSQSGAVHVLPLLQAGHSKMTRQFWLPTVQKSVAVALRSQPSCGL
ncbi:5664_t:CDS:1, partial [Funneliformis caledonium]